MTQQPLEAILTASPAWAARLTEAVQQLHRRRQGSKARARGRPATHWERALVSRARQAGA